MPINLAWYEGASDLLDLIPLHRPDDTAPDGRRLGKAALDLGWQMRPYDTFDDWERLQDLIAAGHNVGVRPKSGFLVADYDKRRDPDGAQLADFLACLREDGIERGQVPTVRTGRDDDSEHLHFRVPVGFRPHVKSLRWPAFDFKHGEAGHQVVCAGSIHPDTGLPYVAQPGPRPADAPVLGPAVMAEIQRDASHAGSTAEAEATEGRIALADAQALLFQLDTLAYRGDHSGWLALGMAFWHATGGSAEGMAAFIAWCERDPDYKRRGVAADVIERWPTWDWRGKDRPITARWLLWSVRNAGGTVPREVQRTLDRERLRALVMDVEPLTDEETGEILPQAARVELREQRPWPPLEEFRGAILTNRYNCTQLVGHLELMPALNNLTYDIELQAERPEWDAARHGRRWNEPLKAVVAHLLKDRYGLGFPLAVIEEGMYEVATLNRYDPLVDFLDLCAEGWDGQERIDTFLVDYLQAEDTPYVRAVSRTFFLGAATRGLATGDEGAKVDTMLVLESQRQGAGKSTAARALSHPYFVDDLSFADMSSKAGAEKLRGKWIAEIADLSGMKRAEVQAVKAFISRQVDHFRPAYARRADSFPRRCVFIGTTNDVSDYLIDPTGNRRFLPVRVTDGLIDVARIERDREQLWGEAVRYVRARESATLPQAVWELAAEEQAKRTAQEPWHDLIEEVVEAAEAEGRRVITSADLFSAVGKPRAHRGLHDAAKIGSIMSKLGYVRAAGSVRDTSGARVRGYVRADDRLEPGSNQYRR